MTEQTPSQESQPLPPIEQKEWQGTFWRAAAAQAASEKHPERNEDYILTNKDLGLFALCDGMGGVDDGEIASARVAHSVEEYFKTVDWELDDHEMIEFIPRSMIKAFRYAQAQLIESRGQAGMDTTATCLLVRQLKNGESLAVIGHVGDCRGYSISKEGQVRQMTEDDDLMSTPEGAKVVLGNVPASEIDTRRKAVRREISEMEDKRQLSQEAQTLFRWRNMTMSVSEPKMSVAVDVFRFPTGARIALLSDGVYENLGDRRAAGLLSKAPQTPVQEQSREMVSEAQQNGHTKPKNIPTHKKDDISVLVVERI